MSAGHSWCCTAARVGDHGSLSLLGLKLGLGGWLIGATLGPRSEPFDAPPAFLPAARVDRACPPSGPRALCPARRPPRPRRVLSVRRLCRSAHRGTPRVVRARALRRARG